MQTASGSRAPRINDVQHSALHVKQRDPKMEQAWSWGAGV